MLRKADAIPATSSALKRNKIAFEQSPGLITDKSTKYSHRLGFILDLISAHLFSYNKNLFF